MVASVGRECEAFDGKPLLERNHDAVARLAADYPRDVAMASGILGEHDVTRPETPDCTVADFDLDLAGERNNILASWRRVIVASMGYRHAPKQDSVHRLKLGYLHVPTQVEFNLKVFEVGFVVRSSV